jgi:transcriptional regulator with XRE-family HTH domain
MSTPQTFAGQLRTWRNRRRLSQLALASDAGLSQRHLSFLESGKARPSREMVERLALHLDIPPRETNALLVSAGFAPTAGERPIDHPEMRAALAVIETILEGHAPHPALAVDRQWTLLRANATARFLMAGVAPALLVGPVNVLRISLHPDGLAPRIVNFRQWRAHIVHRLSAQAEASGDPQLATLLDEIRAYPVPPGALPYQPPGRDPHAGIAVPLQMASEAGTLSFLSTTTVFGTPVDILLSELVIESFFPADAETARAMSALAATLPQ